MDVYIILIYHYITIYVCEQPFLWPLHFGWLLVPGLYEKDFFNNFLNVCLFDNTAVAVSGKIERS